MSMSTTIFGLVSGFDFDPSVHQSHTDVAILDTAELGLSLG